MAQVIASPLLEMSSANEVPPSDITAPEAVQEGQNVINEGDAKPTEVLTETITEDVGKVENAAAAATECTEDGATKDFLIPADTSAEQAHLASIANELTMMGNSTAVVTPFPGNAFLSFGNVVVTPGEMQWEQLVAGSSLVFLTDRNLVPDSLFVSMAQMEPCQLGELDRCGAYKSREIGFTGLKCKYCHGQPGFGRYFPASVRSLAQTTTSQTIIKHIAHRCQYCPSYVRSVVVELERQHEETAKSSDKSKKPHGGRKLFFERIWSRLHGVSLPDSSAADGEKPVSVVENEVKPTAEQQGTEVAAEPSNANPLEPALDPSAAETDNHENASSSGNDDEPKKNHEASSYPLKKRKHLFRSLPTQKRKKRSSHAS